MMKYLYHDLDKHFTISIKLSSFFNDNIRIPRKLKKESKTVLWYPL